MLSKVLARHNHFLGYGICRLDALHQPLEDNAAIGRSQVFVSTLGQHSTMHTTMSWPETVLQEYGIVTTFIYDSALKW